MGRVRDDLGALALLAGRQASARPGPFRKPTGLPGLYNALPPPFAIAADEREDLRSRLRGRSHGQAPAPDVGALAAPVDPGARARSRPRHDLAVARRRTHRSARSQRPRGPRRPRGLLDAFSRRPLHLAFAADADAFAKLLAASDLLVTFNFSATTIVSAIASGSPRGPRRQLLRRSAPRRSPHGSPERPSAPVRAWLNRASPVPRVPRLAARPAPSTLPRWPSDNPYTTAIRTAEVLEEGAFVDAMGDAALRRGRPRRPHAKSGSVSPAGRGAPQGRRPRGRRTSQS